MFPLENETALVLVRAPWKSLIILASHSQDVIRLLSMLKGWKLTANRSIFGEAVVMLAPEAA